MAMRKRRRHAQQPSVWVSSTDRRRSAGHPFHERLNRVLDEAGFDAFIEKQRAKFYADGVAPSRYFRMLLCYLEGLESERAIAWRAAGLLSFQRFLDVALYEPPLDHSTVSRTRRRIDVETHLAVFTWVLQRLADIGLVKGKTVGSDATTLEANAALGNIVRWDTEESYETFLRRLVGASAISTRTRAEVGRFDRKPPKKGSNDDWMHLQDRDAKIRKMKDGRTHLAQEAGHAVDSEMGAVIGGTVQDADSGDTTTMVGTRITAAEQIEAVPSAEAGLADHSNAMLVALAALVQPLVGRRRKGMWQIHCRRPHRLLGPVVAGRRQGHLREFSPDHARRPGIGQRHKIFA
jgi:transposase